MPRFYPTEEAAFRRVEAIKARYGAWPGVHAAGDSYELTYDPEREGEQ